MDSIYAEYWRNNLGNNNKTMVATTRRRREQLNKNTKAVQKYRSNDDNRQRENKLRQIRRIKKGMKPTQQVMEQYGFTQEYVNKLRQESGLEPIDFETYLTPSAVNLANQINRETQKKIDELEKQKTLALQLKESTQGLEKVQKDIKDKYKGKIMNVPEQDKFTLKNVAEWLQKNISSAKKRAIGTIEKRFGKPDNYKTGELYRIFNRWRPGQCDGDVTHCIKDIKELVDFVKTMKDESGRRDLVVDTKFSYLEVVSILMEEYPLIDHENELKAQYEYLQKEKALMKAQVGARKAVRMETESITMNFTDIKDAVKSTFGVDSWYYLYLSMYEETPSRDDMFNLKIISTESNKQPKAVNEGDNYLIVPNNESTKVTFVLIKYKTYNFFGDIRHEYSQNVSKMIREYIKANPVKIAENGGTLFGKKKMSTDVKTMLLKAKVKTEEQTQRGSKTNTGNINLLRKAYLSEKYEKNPSMDESQRVELANAMKHSPLVSLTYLRKFADKVNSEPEKFSKLKYGSE